MHTRAAQAGPRCRPAKRPTLAQLQSRLAELTADGASATVCLGLPAMAQPPVARTAASREPSYAPLTYRINYDDVLSPEGACAAYPPEGPAIRTDLSSTIDLFGESTLIGCDSGSSI